MSAPTLNRQLGWSRVPRKVKKRIKRALARYGDAYIELYRHGCMVTVKVTL